MVKNKCGCRQSGCSTCCPKQKKQGPNIPPGVCARAFDDAFVRQIYATFAAAFLSSGGPAAAAAAAALFAVDGCEQANCDPPICGRANIQAAFEADQGAGFTAASFEIVDIGRIVNPDGTVTVSTQVEVSLTLPNGLVVRVLQLEWFVFNAQCEILRNPYRQILTCVLPPAVAGLAAARVVDVQLPHRFLGRR